MDLITARAIQNQIFKEDVTEDLVRQNFLYFLGNHPRLFQEFTDNGFLTNAEMNYIIQHFFDYDVDPRTFENEFKREMREALPRYNNLKSIELIDEVYELTDNKYIRKITRDRATNLSENGTSTGESTTDSTDNTKQADRELPMETTGTQSIDNIVNWGDGASSINENKSIGSSNITHDDRTTLISNAREDDDTNEEFESHGNPVEHIDKIWQYLIKPKAIEYLLSQLSQAFILVY